MLTLKVNVQTASSCLEKKTSGRRHRMERHVGLPLNESFHRFEPNVTFQLGHIFLVRPLLPAICFSSIINVSHLVYLKLKFCSSLCAASTEISTLLQLVASKICRPSSEHVGRFPMFSWPRNCCPNYRCSSCSVCAACLLIFFHCVGFIPSALAGSTSTLHSFFVFVCFSI